MEKRCEFCKALRPAVYCKSDAAHLCLSCDAKVHSANALSFRHPRTLVCDSCRFRPSLVRCFDHDMFMCQSCDTGHHASLQHRRKVVGCYVGCPSAKELAQLWGFDLKEMKNNCVESEGGTSTRKAKVVTDESSQKSSYFILVQQILDLERLQLANSCSVNVKEGPDGSPFRHDTMWREHKMLNNHVDTGNPLDDVKTEEPLSSPFPQLDNLTSGGNPLNGDSFWQYKSPLHNNEIWLQNMQDLGVCDEVQCFDDVEIPDVDLTFRNFEEVFGSVVEDGNIACSFAYNHPPLFGIEETNDVDKVHQSNTNHHNDCPIRPSYSASSFSASGESSCSEYKDDGLSSIFHLPNDSEISTKLEDGKENAIARYKEKRVLRQEKQGHYTSPRSKSEFKKRGKSQVM